MQTPASHAGTPSKAFTLQSVRDKPGSFLPQCDDFRAVKQEFDRRDAEGKRVVCYYIVDVVAKQNGKPFLVATLPGGRGQWRRALALRDECNARRAAGLPPDPDGFEG